MAKKSTKSKKSRSTKRSPRKPARKKPSSRKSKRVSRRRPAARPKTPRKKSPRRSRPRPKARAARARPSRRAASRSRSLGPRGRVANDLEDARGLGPESGGQSGDIEGLPRVEVADSESVEELAEEGQAFEAEVVDAVENAPEGELRTREVPEDDVPQEYLDED